MDRFIKRSLDGVALHAALDAQRQTRCLSWQQVARETGVAASTLQRTKLNGTMETDGVLSMAKWMERPLEDFIQGYEGEAREKPAVAKYRFNCKALYAALDGERRAHKMTWVEVGEDLGGLPPGMLTRLAKGGRIGVHVMINAVGWLGRTVASFSDPSVTGRKG
ncbi:MAG: hypothetical protein WAN35_17785 [Terracidiphilus sp.]